MKNSSLLVFATIFLLFSCRKDLFEVKRGHNSGINRGNISLKSNCETQLFGDWDFYAMEDSLGNQIPMIQDTLKFSQDTNDWGVNFRVGGLTCYNVYSNKGGRSSYPSYLFAVDCENGIFSLGYMSCGVYFVHYRITYLTNSTFEVEYDSVLNSGNGGMWYGAQKMKYRRP